MQLIPLDEHNTKVILTDATNDFSCNEVNGISHRCIKEMAFYYFRNYEERAKFPYTIDNSNFHYMETRNIRLVNFYIEIDEKVISNYTFSFYRDSYNHIEKGIITLTTSDNRMGHRFHIQKHFN